jgi:hypothetical protein
VNKKILLSAGALLVAGLAVAIGFSTPEPACAICLCPDGPPNYQTPQDWGIGTDCSSAQSDLLSQTWAVAHADCSPHMPCNTSLVVEACHDPSETGVPGQYVADGYLKYSCRDECGPPTP